MSSDAAASTTAVIAAAGSGERLGAGGPKAFVPLAGRSLLDWSVDAFRVAGVARIVVAAPPGRQDRLGEDLVIVDGGETRSASVANALGAVGTELVAIHDAARPLVTPELIEGVLAILAAEPEAAGAIAATRVTDTIKRTVGGLANHPPQDGESPVVVTETLDRDELWAAQTPQAFRVTALREALAAHPDPASLTDESMALEAVGGRVLICPSPTGNFKVTTRADLDLAAAFLQRSELR